MKPVAMKSAKISKATSKAQPTAKAQKAQKVETKAKTSQNARQSDPKASVKTLDNCYRVLGGYWVSVQALRSLGVNKAHPFAAILAAVKKAYGKDAWKEFSAVKPRNKETGKDADGRALQNVSVIARKDYGAPLHEIGYEVKWNGREKTAGLFKVGK